MLQLSTGGIMKNELANSTDPLEHVFAKYHAAKAHLPSCDLHPCICLVWAAGFDANWDK
jgi:hypothetical protein